MTRRWLPRTKATRKLARKMEDSGDLVQALLGLCAKGMHGDIAHVQHGEFTEQWCYRCGKMLGHVFGE